MLASLTIDELRGTPVARLGGEVDASNARELAAMVIDAVPNSAMGLVLDLSETTYLDSSGVQLLFDLAERLRRRQQELRLVVAPDSFVGDVLNAVNLGGMVQICPTVQDALATFDGTAA